MVLSSISLLKNINSLKYNNYIWIKQLEHYIWPLLRLVDNELHDYLKISDFSTIGLLPDHHKLWSNSVSNIFRNV